RCSNLRGRVFNRRLHVFREISCAISVYDLRYRDAVAQAQTLRIARQRPRFEKDGSEVGTRQNEQDIARHRVTSRCRLARLEADDCKTEQELSEASATDHIAQEDVRRPTRSKS